MVLSNIDFQSATAHAAALGTGIFLHLAFFRQGEWDLAIPSVFGTFLAAQGVAAVYLTTQDYAVSAAVKTVIILSAYVIAGITASILTYRVFFHRLNIFPGSIWARVSNWYATSLAAKNLHLYEEVEALHQKYGDFVRTGPRELSVNHPDAVAAINSAQSPCTKGPWYDAGQPRISLQNTRDKKEHGIRRKTWDRAFGSKALRVDYEPRVNNYTNQLLGSIDAGKGKPMNVSDWFNFYSFDVMGDLAFGKPFGMLEKGVTSYFMKATHDDMKAIGYLGHLTWLMPFIKITPGLNATSITFWKWTKEQIDKRIANKPNQPDIMSYILDDYDTRAHANKKQARLDLEEEAHLIVVAGSDTTAASLTCVFYQLCQDPQQITNLRKELDTYFRDYHTPDSSNLAKVKHLDAVINETLRLNPPVPSGVQRVTPPEGLQIGNTYIPGDTIVQIPMHTHFRDPRNFVRPNEFIPERWTTKPELVLNAGAYMPFNVGPYGCVGKQLALMEMRYVISQLVYRYDVAFAPGQSPKKFFEEKKDAFTLALGGLDVIFTDRK